MAELAYRNALDPELKMKTREGWYQKYTNAALALNQLLKDSQYKDYERRLRVIEESKRNRRLVLSRAEVRRWLASVTRKDRNKQHRKTSNRRRSV